MKKYLQFEQLESRQLLAADVFQPVTNSNVADASDIGAVFATSQSLNTTSSTGANASSNFVLPETSYFNRESLETRVLKLGERYVFRSAEEIVVFTPSPSGEWVRTSSLDLNAPILELVADDTGTRLVAVTGNNQGYGQLFWDNRTGKVTYHLLSMNEEGIPAVLDQMSRIGGYPGRTEVGVGYSNAVEFNKESGSFLIHHAVNKSFAESVLKNYPAQIEFVSQQGNSAEADFLRMVYLESA